MRNWKKRSVTVFLAFMLMFGAYPGLFVSGGISYAAPGDFEIGDGTSEAPFQIESAEQLSGIRNHPDSHFVLMNDIDMSAYNASTEWVPIGDSTSPFTGTLDGQHFTITNLLIDRRAVDEPAGLFGVVGANGQIRNLVIEDAEVRGGNNTGILAGAVDGAVIDRVGVAGIVYGEYAVGGLVGYLGVDSNVSNSYAAGYVEGRGGAEEVEEVKVEGGVGGLVGTNSASSVTDSHASSTVKGTREVGGLVGWNTSTVVRSHSTGDVTGQREVGGLVGANEDNGTIMNSSASGDVVGERDLGGLAGINQDGADIAVSHATGNVVGNIAGNVVGTKYVGGLVGANVDATLSTSYASGNVNGDEHTGGLVGLIQGSTITSSYATGTITGSLYTGGFAGAALDSELLNNHATGNVIGSQIAGGLVGLNDNGNISFSYATGHASGQLDVGGLVGELEDAVVSASFAVGNVEGCNDIGGLIGDSDDALVSNSYATGAVTGIVDSTVCIYGAYGDSIGGLVGDNKNATIENSFAIGRVTGLVSVGGLAGINEDGGITRSYYDMETSGQSDTNGQGLTSEEMKDGSNYEGWNFDNTLWTIQWPHHNGYPYLSTIQAFITYVGNGTDHGSEQYRSYSYHFESQVDILEKSADWTKSGYLFQGWNTAADGSGETYQAQDTVTLTRDMVLYAIWRQSAPPQPQPQLSDNANLSVLTVTSADEELALTPTFAAGTTSYQTETKADEVTIKAIPSDANASVSINKVNLAGSKTIALDEGNNEFEIAVRAESGTVKIYKLSIQRLPEIEELPPEVPACTFRDIKGHWAESLICEALHIGIVEGPSETIFQPQKNITRVEFAAMLLRTLEIDSAPAGSELTFIDRDQIPAWATDVIGAALKNGILQGYPDQTLRPMQMVSRSEMVVMMARALKWDLEPGDTSFADDAEIPAWAKGYVQGAAERELVTGRDGNRFSPMHPATRAEATTLLLRLWHNLATDAN
ncbi:GLUG motif-containing protein [Paenibacillus sp. PAMC21692]|uniref:GLUG motif-containing protein n=1 Tax=Paenibacillus sp. PAMC21692 TaxID=2762320 RepID=UPI00164D45D3|nr:GLUG motif-containing protein [Paenibacillus sp. PAMC21692]QNK57335.1 S-layer homology domain-containing protein [Paenibacillus sp. PAMC21692]